MSLFAKNLLKEAKLDTTVHEWICDTNNGFFRYYGALQNYLGIHHPKGSAYNIPFYIHRDNSFAIRFPAVGLLSVIGINVGLYGAVCFSKLQTKKQQKSFSFLVLSNIFFCGINLSAIVYHCLLPNDHQMRYLFRYFDHVCTGIAGIFMGFALQTMENEKNNLMAIKDTHTQIAVIGSCMILPMIHPIFGDVVYIGGLSFSLLNVLKNNWNMDEDTHDDIKGLNRTLLSVSVITGIGVLANKHITFYTNGHMNIMRTMFFASDLGYMACTYYGLKYYEISE